MTQIPNSHESTVTATAVGLALEYPSAYRPLSIDSRSRIVCLHAEAVVALWSREMGISNAGAGLAMILSVISGSNVSASRRTAFSPRPLEKYRSFGGNRRDSGHSKSLAQGQVESL